MRSGTAADQRVRTDTHIRGCGGCVPDAINTALGAHHPFDEHGSRRDFTMGRSGLLPKPTFAFRLQPKRKATLRGVAFQRPVRGFLRCRILARDKPVAVPIVNHSSCVCTTERGTFVVPVVGLVQRPPERETRGGRWSVPATSCRDHVARAVTPHDSSQGLDVATSLMVPFAASSCRRAHRATNPIITIT